MATTSSVATSKGPRLAAFLTVGAVVAGIVAVAMLRRPEGPGPGAAGVLPRTGAPRPPAPPEASVDVSLITVIYGVRTERAGTDRSRADAHALARRALERIAAGETFEHVLAAVTDDRDEVGKPFNRGSYTFAQGSPAMPAVKRLAFSTPVGLVHAEPIDTGTAFVILRRDR